MREPGVYRLSEAGVRQVLVRQGHLTPDSVLYSLVLGLGLGSLGDAPLWPLVFVGTLFVLLLLKSFQNAARMNAGLRSFEVIVESDRVLVRRQRREGLVQSIITRSEIARLIETPGRGLAIVTKDP